MADATLRMVLLGEDRSAGKALKGVGDQAEKTHSRLSQVASVASKALAAGFLAAGAAAIKLTKGAAEDEAAASKLAQTMQKAAGATKSQVAATEDWITAQGKAFGVADDDLRPALSKLVVATHDVGKAQHLASLAMNVSAGTGKDLGAVSMALAKAQNGNVGALGRLGIATKDADGKTKSLHQITKDLAATYSGAAATAADTTAGKQRRLSVALSEAGETIGYKLLPAMLKLTDAATAALDWMTKHPKLMKDIAIGVGVLAAAIVALRVEMLAASAVSKVMAVSQAMQAVAAGTATEAQIALNTAMRANVIGLIVTALALLVAGLIYAYKHSETFRDIVNGAFHAVGVAVLAVWNNLLAPVFEFWGKAISVVLHMWGAMLGLLAHVPGMGWAKDLADKLNNAADAAANLDLKIRNIPTHKEVYIKVTTQQSAAISSINKPRVQHNAVGSSFFAGGWSRVGERGPEDVFLPRGSSVLTADQSARLAAGGAGADLGTLTVVVRTDTGELIEQKLARLKRTRGGARLAFA